MKVIPIDHDEIRKFVQKNGPEVYAGDWKDFDSYIDYFASIRRILILRNKRGRIIGIACLTNVSDLDFLMQGRLPTDDPDGKILYVHGVVIHKNVRHRNIMSIMLRHWMRVFPQIEYLVFKRPFKSGRYKVMPVSKIL